MRDLASRSVPSLATKRVSPHTIRHTTAVHLLRAGVDINTIRAWLGHVSLDTTHIYAEVDMEMKAKALASVDITERANLRPLQRAAAVAYGVPESPVIPRAVARTYVAAQARESSRFHGDRNISLAAT